MFESYISPSIIHGLAQRGRFLQFLARRCIQLM